MMNIECAWLPAPPPPGRAAAGCAPPLGALVVRFLSVWQTELLAALYGAVGGAAGAGAAVGPAAPDDDGGPGDNNDDAAPPIRPPHHPPPPPLPPSALTPDRRPFSKPDSP